MQSKRGMKWKTSNFLLNGQNTLSKGFPSFWWYDWSYDFILKFSKLIFQWETKFSLGILCSKPILSTLYRDQTLEIYSGRIRGKP